MTIIIKKNKGKQKTSSKKKSLHFFPNFIPFIDREHDLYKFLSDFHCNSFSFLFSIQPNQDKLFFYPLVLFPFICTFKNQTMQKRNHKIWIILKQNHQKFF